MVFQRPVFITCFLLVVSISKAEIILPKIFSDNMVLQRNKQVTVWGKASPGEKITVSFKKQNKTAITDASGNWKIFLVPMEASSDPSSLTLKGNNTITLRNILIGEVWLCSGQSNMEYTMRKNSKVVKKEGEKNSPVDELDRANNPQIRIFLVTQKNLLDNKQGTSGWSVAKDSALRSFSAAGYFFAKELYDKLHVPIGMISAAIPGSDIEPWLPGKIKKQNDAGSISLDTSVPGKFYPKMIQPLSPFAIKGFLWYQGETNCFQNENIEYTYKMEALINGWRKLWNGDLPFYYVQIAPFYYSKSKNQYPLDEETEPKFWEAQSLVMKIPNTGMAVINDLSKSPDDLHPEGKWEVGRRLAQWALAKDYGIKVMPSGPMYSKMKIEKGAIELKFDYVGKGLMSKDGKALNWFTIAGDDGKFVKADAVIKGDKVIVSSPDVPHPVNVRFAWSEAAQPNFFNKDGLPAVPFRTDNPYGTNR
jgi:sialate O-acetylesterase